MKVHALALVLAASALFASPAPARVIPVAQVSPNLEQPAVQRLTARHVVVMESTQSMAPADHLVVYDSRGIEAPRDISPPGLVAYTSAAAWEGEDGTLRILVFGPPTPAWSSRVACYSPDGGRTWKNVPGFGLWSAGSNLQIRLGTAEIPFVLALGTGYWSISASGTATRIAEAQWGAVLYGSDLGGTRFLVRMVGSSGTSSGVGILDLEGRAQYLFDLSDQFSAPQLSGWLTPSGAVYLNAARPGVPFPKTYTVAFWESGNMSVLASSDWYEKPIAAPTADFSGAWIASHEVGVTTFSSHTPSGGLVELWRDPSAPWIASLHAGASGQHVLLRRKRLRPLGEDDETWGLAIWQPGQPAPAVYDEVFLTSNGYPRGFAHLDVDAAAAGEPFLIDTGPDFEGGYPGTPPEQPKPLGLVRASLRQRLVIPAAARTLGQMGSDWRTDLLIRNPESTPVTVTARLLPNTETTARPADAKFTIGPGAIAVWPDALSGLFHLDRGSGAILLMPEGNRGIRATSRTYTKTALGTYGMSVDGVDAQSAGQTDFPLTFSGALLGSGFRTNLVGADTSGRGSGVEVRLSGTEAPFTRAVPPDGQVQLDGLASIFGTPGGETRAARLTATSGSVIPGLISIDDATNDPSWFGPDYARMRYWGGPQGVPAIVHADGVTGARFRTDLYVFNPQAVARDLGLGVAGRPGVTLGLAPGEFRLIPDALWTLFGVEGARPLFVNTIAVRMTSRTYSVGPDGATYGMVIPPLDALEIAGFGETLEILGPAGGADLRTNLALVCLGSNDAAAAHVEILDQDGTLRSAFDTPVPGSSTVQIDDLFRARGLGDGPDAVAIRVTFTRTAGLSGGTFAAYATTIDNGTNDPVYFAGALGSH